MVGMDVASNSTWLLGSHNFPILVTSPSGETLGEARLTVNGSRWMCLENPLYSQQQSAASTTATQGTESSSRDGLSAGAWVGIAAGIAVAALAGSGAIAAVVLRRRHRRRLNMPYPSVYRNGASVSEGGKSPKASDAASALPAVDQLNISQEGLGMAALLRVRFGGLDGLEIGQLIGRGAHGRIYRGTLRGTPVAVKVIDHAVGPDSKQTHTSKVVAAEVGLLLALSHPRIIRVLKCATIKLKSPGSGLTGGNSGASAIEDRRMNAGSPSGRGVATGAPVTPEDLENPSTPPPQIADRIPSMQGTSGESSSAELQREGAGSGSEFTCGTQHGSDMSGPGLYETWLVLEYANAGSLYQALFIKRRFHDADGAPNVLLILSILIEVAEGMAYLHECDIVHGDLKPDNILLKSGDDHNSLTAVVADFGLARLISDGSLKQSMVQTTGIVGTIEYMSPELLGHGLLSRKADVWSFGLIMLEMWTGEARFKGMSAAQILYASSHNEQLPLPEGSPYHQLVKRCLVHESRLRPSFEELLKELHVCYATVRSSL
jgi:serine/threonine protein kinase